MPYYKNFEEVFNELKQIMIDNNLSVEDLADNSGADPQLIRILFDESTDVVGSISRIFEFTNTKLFTKQLQFRMYHLTDSGTQIRVARLIKPKCSIYYDKANGNFYKFEYRFKTRQGTETRTEIIKNEIKVLVDDYLSGSLTVTYQKIIK